MNMNHDTFFANKAKGSVILGRVLQGFVISLIRLEGEAPEAVYVTFFGRKNMATSQLQRHWHNSPSSGDYPCFLYKTDPN